MCVLCLREEAKREREERETEREKIPRSLFLKRCDTLAVKHQLELDWPV